MDTLIFFKSSNDEISFTLLKETGEIISLDQGDIVKFIGKPHPKASSILWDKTCDIIDSTQGQIRVELNEFDTSTAVDTGLAEIRLEKTNGQSLVLQQYEFLIKESVQDSHLFGGNYNTHAIIYGGFLENKDQTVLDYFDHILLDETDFYYLDSTMYHDKIVLSVSFWSSPNKNIDPTYGLINGPADLGMPQIQNERSHWVYTMDDSWLSIFTGDLELLLVDLFLRDIEIAGVMVEDCWADLGAWGLSDSEMRTVWRDRYEDPDDPLNTNIIADWNKTRLETLQASLRTLVDAYTTDKIVIANGPVRAFNDSTSTSGVHRLHENAGSDIANNINLSVMRIHDPADPSFDSSARALQGDYLQVNCIDASGFYGEWYDSTSGIAVDNFYEASKLAIDFEGSLGISFGYSFDWLKDQYNLILSPVGKDTRWFLY